MTTIADDPAASLIDPPKPSVPEAVSKSVVENELVVCAVLSGNRNFEGRIQPEVKANYLMSPPLVVAYALAGTMDIDLQHDPIGKDRDGNDVFLKDVWPSQQEVADIVEKDLTRDMFLRSYADVFKGERAWIGPIPATAPLRTISDCVADHVQPDLIEQAIRDGLRLGLFSEAELVAVGVYR